MIRKVLEEKNSRCSNGKQAYERRDARLYHTTAQKSRRTRNYDSNSHKNPKSGDPSPPLAYHHNAVFSQDQENQPPQAQFQSEQQVSAQVYQKRKLRPSLRSIADETSAQAAGLYEGQSLADTPANTHGDASSVKEQTVTQKLKPDNEISKTMRRMEAAKKRKKESREREKQARKSRIEDLNTNGIERPEGPCKPCKDRGMVCKISKDPTFRNFRCLHCLQSNRIKCSFPDLEVAVPEPVAPSQERRLPYKSTPIPIQNQIYSLLWFRGLARTEKHRVLAELITSNNRYIESGTPRLPGPCRPCFELGLKCWVIKEGSLASELSKTKRCFNCLDDSTRHRMRYQMKEPSGCCNVLEGSISLVCATTIPTIVPDLSANNTTKVTLKSGAAEIRKTMTVPLKSADDVNTSPYGEYFRRQSRLHEELFPNIFADDDPVRLMPSSLSDITELAGELYQFIEDLSFAVDAFHSARSSSPLPFSPVSLLELNNLPTEKLSLPTVAGAIKQGLGIQGSLATVEASGQIRQLGLDRYSLFEVLPLVTSILLHNLMLDGHWINPFSHGEIAMRTEIVLTSIRNAFPPEYLGNVLPSLTRPMVINFNFRSELERKSHRVFPPRILIICLPWPRPSTFKAAGQHGHGRRRKAVSNPKAPSCPWLDSRS